jgi:hypothetical protein
VAVKSEFSSLGREETFVVSIRSRSAVRPTKPPVQRVLGDVSLRAKRQESEYDHSRPSSAQINDSDTYISIPPDVSMAWCLIGPKQRKISPSLTLLVELIFVLKFCL